MTDEYLDQYKKDLLVEILAMEHELTEMRKILPQIDELQKKLLKYCYNYGAMFGEPQ
jgi:hypothetical protein